MCWGRNEQLGSLKEIGGKYDFASKCVDCKVLGMDMLEVEESIIFVSRFLSTNEFLELVNLGSSLDLDFFFIILF